MGELRQMKIYKGPLFSIPLAHLMWLSYTEYTAPPVLIDALEYLDREELMSVEGLFREPGDTEEINFLRNQYDSGEAVNFSTISTPHSAASLLKLFFRKLPEPLFTFKEYDNFKGLWKIDDDQTRINQATQCIQNLPVINRFVIYQLFDYLHRLSLKGSINKMVPENLGIVWGPTGKKKYKSKKKVLSNPFFFFTVLWQKEEDPMEQTIASQTLSNVVGFIIEKYSEIMSKFSTEFQGK